MDILPLVSDIARIGSCKGILAEQPCLEIRGRGGSQARVLQSVQVGVLDTE